MIDNGLEGRTVGDVEIKMLPLQLVGIKTDDSGGARTFCGYGAVFNNRDSYDDVILPGAFKRSIKDASGPEGLWPVMLWGHGAAQGGSDLPIGTWSSFTEDDHGLVVVGELADTTLGRDIYTLMKMTPRPALSGLSIGYVARSYSWGSKAGEPRRTLKQVDLAEVSVVGFPANRRARISDVKSEAARARTLSSLIDIGWPDDLARRFVEAGMKAAALTPAEVATAEIAADAARADTARAGALDQLAARLRG